MAVTTYINQIHIITYISELRSSLGHDGDICFYVPKNTGKVRGLYIKLGSWNEVMIENGIKTYGGLGLNANYAERLDAVNVVISEQASLIEELASNMSSDELSITANGNRIAQIEASLTALIAKMDTSITGVGKTEFGNDVTYTQPDTNNQVTVTVEEGAEIYNNASADTYKNIAVDGFSHAEGKKTIAEGVASHAEGVNTYAKGTASHAEGNENMAIAAQSHVEGSSNVTRGINSHAEGLYNTISVDGYNSHAEGSQNSVSSTNGHAEGNSNTVSGDNAHAEGSSNRAINNFAHAEGSYNKSDGSNSHTEGTLNEATANATHAEGKNTKATAEAAHSEGNGTIASAAGAHAEGSTTTASGVNSHASGADTVASGIGSFAEGSHTSAVADFSHAAGLYTQTKDTYSFVMGKYNDYSILKSILFMVGNGTDADHRSNALYLTANGELYVSTDVIVNGVSFNSLSTDNTFFGTQSEYEQAVLNDEISGNDTVIKYDTEVTEDSTNLITSGAVFDAIDEVSNAIPTNYIVSAVKDLQNNTYVLTPSSGDPLVIEASADINGYLKTVTYGSDQTHYIYSFAYDDTTEVNITIDKAVTENSTNLITSGAVYQALSTLGSGVSPVFFGTPDEYTVADNNSQIRPETVVIKYEKTVCERSDNLVTSGAVYDAISVAAPSILHTFTQAEINSDIDEIWE